jgi:DNA-binding NarL/FixJ family response regulator
MKTKVLIVDDHPVTRSGIRYILDLNGQFNIIGEAKDGVDAIKKVSDKKPDIVIMDVSMPEISGIEATKQITKTQPDIKVIALSIHSGQKFVKEMLQAGAAGYILKDEAPEELITAIDKIIKGDIYLSSGVTRVALSKEETEPVEIGPEILKTKLLRPPDLPSYLVRNRIIDLLERNVTNPFSLISAGAEYGKSIVLYGSCNRTGNSRIIKSDC